jgi:large repetitive protein
MTLDASALGSFGDLATALGLLGPGGAANPAWFEDPVNGGDGSTGTGLKHIMSDAGQRDALLRFVDSVLGPPEARTERDARWVPLFANDDPVLTVYAVVESVPDAHEVRLGVGVEHTTQGGPPTVSTRAHVPLFRFADRGHDLGPGDTPWLLLGRPGGEISVTVDATITTTAPAPGVASLGGVAATVRVPTHEEGDLGFALELKDLQLPAASSPRTFSLDADSTEELGSDLLDLLTGLVRAQADALADDADFRPFAALAGMLGLRDVPDLPGFPVADLTTRGVAAVVDWFETVLEDDDARDAWLGELAGLLGVDAAVDAARDAVVLDLDPLALTVGIRVSAGSGGHPALVPWVEAALAPRVGAPVVARASVDLLRADTGTGSVSAVPDVRLEAVFGSTASRLVGTAAGSDPRVDSLRIGLALDADRNPTFVLTAHGVRLAGGDLREVVDLSTPQAVLDAGTSVLTEALDDALDALGTAAAPLVKRLIGIDAPAGVTGIDAAELLGGPVAALRDYWERLVATPTALGDVLGHLAALVTGVDADPLPEAGTASDPWRVELEDPLYLHVWREGTALHVGLALEVALPVLGEHTATTAVSVDAVELDPSAGSLAFLRAARLAVSLARADGGSTRLGVADLALAFDRLAVELAWTPSAGLHPLLTGDGLALDVPALGLVSGAGGLLPLPLPRLGPGGRVAFDAPDWGQVEAALAGLVSRLGVPEVDALLRLLGWYGGEAHLSLAALLGGDPAGAV